ncbi:hypothetical protein [Streptomyces sp. NPDC102462]|uniref:hypothetical protein n=1 Tax=Streptomyces sp. NPDC102462 TaxID=3366178 RepID=UPI00380CC611
MEDDEIDQAVALIEAMTRDHLTGPELTNHYTDALRAVIETKQEGHHPETPAPARPGHLVNLMTALEESVDKARAARGEDGAGIHQEPDPAAKATALKAPKARPSTKASPGQPRR